MALVATNVAARGLDINDVQLIIQVCDRSLCLCVCQSAINVMTYGLRLCSSVNHHVM